MWVKVKCSCGHYSDVQVLGKAAERERKIAYFEDAGLCKDCYRQFIENQKAIGCEIIEMDYRSQYKAHFEWCDKVANSYDMATKTIKVYVPKDAADFARAVLSGDKIAQFEAIAKMNKDGAKHIYKVIEHVTKEFATECKEYFEKHYPEFYKED